MHSILNCKFTSKSFCDRDRYDLVVVKKNLYTICLALENVLRNRKMTFMLL